MSKRINHKWNDANECKHCKTYREKQSVKTLMAIHNGKDVYKYETKYKYFTVNEGESFVRPNCWIDTYDN